MVWHATEHSAWTRLDTSRVWQQAGGQGETTTGVEDGGLLLCVGWRQQSWTAVGLVLGWQHSGTDDGTKARARRLVARVMAEEIDCAGEIMVVLLSIDLCVMARSIEEEDEDVMPTWRARP